MTSPIAATVPAVPVARNFLHAGGVTFDQAGLTNDSYFIKTLESVMQHQAFSPVEKDSVMGALQGGNLSALSIEDRTEIIDKAGHINPRLSQHNIGPSLNSLVALIQRNGNNQAYTGPGADEILLTLPTKSNQTQSITRGQLLDNEGFGKLIETVFNGTQDPSRIQTRVLSPLQTLLTRLTPSYQNPQSSQSSSWGALSDKTALDFSHWSEAERIQFLEKVAVVGKDGTLSGDETAELATLITSNKTSGANEPSLMLTDAKGKEKVISYDDVMEDATMRGMVGDMWKSASSSSSPDVQKKVGDQIEKGDYTQLSFAERTIILKKLFQASNNVTVSDGIDISDYLSQAFSKSTRTVDSGGGVLVDVRIPTQPGQTLANGTLVTDSELQSSDGFGGLIQRTLRRSGVDLVPNNSAPGSAQPKGIPENNTITALLRMNVSGLDTPAKRLEVLNKIALAGKDEAISQTELRDIQETISRLSGNTGIRV
jgi:hypothetical protein